jgi:hypothetical protein
VRLGISVEQLPFRQVPTGPSNAYDITAVKSIV